MNAMFPAELSRCKNFTVKFRGFCSSRPPIEKINQTTWMINQYELVPDLFRTFGPSISKVSVCFDDRLEPSSDSWTKIVNIAATYKSLTSFELINWQPRIGDPRTLMGFDIHPVNNVRELTIHGSGWSSVMTEQINRIFPDLRCLKLIQINFNDNNDQFPLERLKNLKELEILIEFQSKFSQRNVIAILIAHPNLEHVTLSMEVTLRFWQALSKKLASLPSLKLGYIPKIIAGCNGNVAFCNEKVHLVISPAIEKFECKFDWLKELTLSDADYFPMTSNCDLATVWLDFITENQSIEKLNVFVPGWFKKGHLTIVLENLPRLTKLAILGCSIRMAKILQTLCLSKSIEKIHLINYGGLNDVSGAPGWAIRKDRNNNNFLIQKI